MVQTGVLCVLKIFIKKNNITNIVIIYKSITFAILKHLKLGVQLKII